MRTASMSLAANNIEVEGNSREAWTKQLDITLQYLIFYFE